MSTFKACVSVLTHLQPSMFLLENVDMEAEDEESNLALITKCLDELGFAVKVFKLVATDFGLPQRRIRIYIAGFNRSLRENISWTRVEEMLYAMRLQKQPPDTWT